MANGSGITPRELRNVLFQVVVFAIAMFYAVRFITAITGVLFVLALILLAAMVLNPIITWAENHKIPRPLGVVILAVTVLGLIALLAWLAVPLVIEQFRMLVNVLPEYFARLRSWLNTRSPDLAQRLPINTEQVLNLFGGAIRGVVGYAWNVLDVLASAVVFLVGTIYVLINPAPLAQGFLSIFPRGKQDQVVAIVRRISEQMRAFALAIGLGMLVIFALTWVALTIIDVQPAFLFALIAGFLEMVPLIGPTFSAIPPAFAALVVAGPVKLLYVLLAFFAIQQLESHVVVPLVQSSSLKLHPISIIFAVLIMGGLFGIIGIFLAVPTVAVIKILYEELYLKPTQKDEEGMKKRADEIVGRENNGPGEREK